MEYNIRLEFQAGEDRAEDLVEQLKDYHPAASLSEFGQLEVWITILAENVRQATTTGLAIAGTVDLQLVAIECLLTENFDKRLELTPVPELVGAEGAAEILGITRQAVGQLFTAGKLPGQRLGERGLAFARHNVESIAAQRSTREPGA